MDRQRQYWFRRNRIGWGLEPGSREGWLLTAIFVAVDAGGALALTRFAAAAHPSLPIVWSLIWLAIFLIVVLMKGEPLW